MKGIDAIMKDERVEQVYWSPPDGWWLDLKKGFAFDPTEPPYSGCHTTSEATLAALRRRLPEIQPCQCADCLGLPPADLEVTP